MKFTSQLSARGPYRSKNGLIFGVARGLADHFGFSPFYARLAIVAVALLLCLWPMVLLYIAAALLLPTAPLSPPLTARDQDFMIYGQANLRGLIEGLSDQADKLGQRTRRIEDLVTSRHFRGRKSP
ncbi:MAG: PspC domain-containing protein [Deltaproteobacteria bacterium]|jgi:phage shock protein C|nr:PspC domain-containing protein [Deltaproteobacteria bacterium]